MMTFFFGIGFLFLILLFFFGWCENWGIKLICVRAWFDFNFCLKLYYLYRCNTTLLIDCCQSDGKRNCILIDVGKTFREQVLRWFTFYRIPRLDSVSNVSVILCLICRPKLSANCMKVFCHDSHWLDKIATTSLHMSLDWFRRDSDCVISNDMNGNLFSILYYYLSEQSSNWETRYNQDQARKHRHHHR